MPAHNPAELHPLFRDAFNQRDVDTLTALYEPHVILVVDGKNVCGRENIRAALESMLHRRGRMTRETRTVVESEQGLALLHGGWVVEPAEVKGSGPATRGLSTEVVRRQSDGTWLLVIDSPYTS